MAQAMIEALIEALQPEALIEVSIVTPTYNRRQFIPTLIQIYQHQTYPKENMEWIIIDDGQDKVGDFFVEATLPNIRYIALEEKISIGAKRNLLNKEAKGQIIIAMDDDDYYPPHRIQTIVDTFKRYPKAMLAGSSKMHMYYIDTQKIYTIGPFMANHATNGTMAWRKSYSDKHRYDEFVTKGEETSFLENYIHPMIQLDSNLILVICHTDNTVDKQKLRESHVANKRQAKERMKITPLQLSDVVKEKEVYDFYLGLSATCLK
jgi:glycosyltransferase involved in cell wall biosynthesis